MSETFENGATQVEHEYGASEIQVLEGLEAVRKRPGMYIGSTSESGLHHLVYEIVDNAIDEALAGYCDEITVKISEGDIITVVDNGRGIPVDIQQQTGKPALEVVFTILHAGGKFGGGGYKVSGGLHGVGASVVNALSEWLEVRVYKDGKIYEMKFSRGNVTQPMQMVGDTERHGTEVVFKPDRSMFEITEYNYETLHTRMREEAFLNAGVRIRTIDERAGREQSDEMHYAGGIREFVTWLNRAKTPIHDSVVYMSGSREDSMAEVAFQYNDGYNESIISFANNVHTPEGGMHEEGFKRALTTVLNNYGKKMKILKDEEKVSGEDCREGLTCIISVKLTDAQFEGQTKAKLGNSEIRTLVAGIVSDKLEEFLEENPGVGKAILDKALMANRAREAARKARESIRRKTALGGAAMPDKLRDCNENNPELTEIYIVEGDSAGGSATQGRDSRFQAILPLWGKMLNVEKARADKVYGNDKLQPVITALGAGIGDEFDVSRLRYHKVIIMADADVDGSHIRTLLLTFFFRFMRPLIEHGYVYAAVPPLFKLSRGKTTRLAFSEEERDRISGELRGDNPNAKVDISRFKGLGEMNPHELWETTMDPEKRTLKRIELDDAIRADETFSILMGEKVEPRKEFIERNAKYAVNLDY
ncbi:DNA topoisomerase (ATP-hydrolyzing) subunit B [Flavonifractor sp. DFI.6.63]|uniref:DNA gyrase subunit B n=1 Tax=Lawsonibacter hominis TaxID=2763053 RepID=A0A8J6JEW3_9FIRM|nr:MULTISPECIES: DNA topoisomerase (ATP-hydrolyzing) subunit B [Oscillospiraceae]MBS1383059.1 DNA topoisomerase (ATP-hydrolyzing) subunit B [Flavonifractor sp.]MDU2194192.1 DNA topoisomerase (ATP-hydrolyzing) subunit B [Clostridiales bacterium]MDY2976920.1 DNA topoisomerase (ATP-hydrolyzing) subunit B [Oscillospiraceae bacterium]MBC5733510.1 DNA topoisomerase (ATP-hydrolyzing) subunit B [Lawsonibacter hominis]MCI6399079.1 DNA topoisomerase (ATP-hydrolyzing) subunit B [Lawsonibacter sp.]